MISDLYQTIVLLTQVIILIQDLFFSQSYDTIQNGSILLKMPLDVLRQANISTVLLTNQDCVQKPLFIAKLWLV